MLHFVLAAMALQSGIVLQSSLKDREDNTKV
jgi:hypothetical protein